MPDRSAAGPLAGTDARQDRRLTGQKNLLHSRANKPRQTQDKSSRRSHKRSQLGRDHRSEDENDDRANDDHEDVIQSPDRAVQIPHRRLEAESLTVHGQDRRLNLVPSCIAVAVLVKHRKRRFGGLEVREEAGNVLEHDMGDSGFAEGIVQPSGESLRLVGGCQSRSDLVGRRVGLQNGLPRHLTGDVAERGGSCLSRLTQATESLSDGNLGDLTALRLSGIVVAQRVCSSRNIARVDVQRSQALDVELLLSQSVFVRVAMELEAAC